ncbi:MAG: murein L,D-transpeptidase catalytic domain family protein [Caulobacteraceae bacterium]
MVRALPTPGAPLASPTPSASNAPANPLVSVARAGLQRLGARVRHRDIVAVADFSRPSSEPRLHLVEMTSGVVESFLVAHGRGSDPTRTGWLRRFSNAPGSDCTSEGAYLTGDYYVGEHGRSLRLVGQDPTNSNALARAIVIHPAWYASPQIVRAEGMLGRSEGCFAVSQAKVARVLQRLSPGHLLIATRLT